MKKLYEGKTKDVYELENGNVLLKFKDTVTGKDGVFDPGANHIGLTIEGIGNLGLRLTEYFFTELKKRGVPTHFVSADIEENAMEVLPATVFGKGIEVICRFRAVGSFIRRYGKYIESGTELPGYVEITLKDDDAEDPLITKEGLEILGILKEGEYETLTKMTRDISTVIKELLAAENLELYDIKLEFGRDKDGKIILIDEISGGNMRVYENGAYVEPLKLEEKFLKAVTK